MTPSQTLMLLRQLLPARYPMLLVGPPGVGKSDLVGQAAQEIGCRVVYSHPAVKDPTEFGGLPWPNASTGRADYLPIGELGTLIQATEPTIWVLDDLGQATAATQAACMQWLLARQVNGMCLPDCVSIVACTNRRSDRAGVNGLLEPVKSRFVTIVNVEPDVDDWANWAIDAGVPVPVIALMRYRPELLCAANPTTEMTNSPSPRTWGNLGKLVDLCLPAAIRMEAYAGAVGQGAAVEYMAFETMYAALVTADDILMSPHTAPIPERPGELYAVATALAARANVQTIGRIGTYAERLHGGAHGDFAALTLRDSLRRSPEIKTTGDYIKIVCGPIGRLILGSDGE